MKDVVVDRLRDADLREAMLLEKLAHGESGLSPELVAAVQAAEATLTDASREHVAGLIVSAFKAAHLDQANYPGASMAAYAAALACRRFSKLSAEQLHELTWRWDKVMHTVLGPSVLRLNLRTIAERFLVPA